MSCNYSRPGFIFGENAKEDTEMDPQYYYAALALIGGTLLQVYHILVIYNMHSRCLERGENYD